MIIGDSPATTNLKGFVALAAQKHASVLLQGPTGAGKDVVARAIHAASPRRQGPFVAVNCGALPEQLVVSELFGFEKGAFTGALSTRAGKFEQADGGTIFLDEIGEMPLPAQAALLRILETREVERIGGRGPLPVDVRVICATNRNLEERVAESRFRADLFYRINVFPIEVPPLHRRAEDIPQLIEHFVAQYELAAPPRFSAEDIATLQRYDWPGNIRELRNLVERAGVIHGGEQVDLLSLHPALFRLPAAEQTETDAVWSAAGCPSDDVAPGLDAAFDDGADAPRPQRREQHTGLAGLDPTQLASAILAQADGISMPIYIKKLERALIDRAINRCNGSVSAAARVLRTNRTTIIAKIKRFG